LGQGVPHPVVALNNQQFQRRVHAWIRTSSAVVVAWLSSSIRSACGDR
jgi:hypothetical protein